MIDDRNPPFLPIVALTIPLSSVHELPLSVTVTAALASGLAASAARNRDASAIKATTTGHNRPAKRSAFMQTPEQRGWVSLAHRRAIGFGVMDGRFCPGHKFQAGRRFASAIVE